ncbi:hypothetical protein D9756_009274 [Leucocoprinus leucothites]|uniref:Nephrocystin 3-like N-terminal domain-containing protein n=1 Tax=Leucocoprinus leucothites TaxID=201217 RepID=A0A8H5CY19_9AGAR|nr:hypothetical protein D9756_009274 [Leucoagaricus leucothites]
MKKFVEDFIPSKWRNRNKPLQRNGPRGHTDIRTHGTDESDGISRLPTDGHDGSSRTTDPSPLAIAIHEPSHTSPTPALNYQAPKSASHRVLPIFQSSSMSSSINSVQISVTRDRSSTPSVVLEPNNISQIFVDQEQTPSTGSAPRHSPMQLSLPTSILASQFHDDETTASQTGGKRVHGFFANAHYVNMYNPVMQDFSNQTANPFMENLAKHTMPGAAYDSSARFPPPRCHAGTRLETVEQARNFFNASGCKKRLLWIVGPAGVGKSAIMQTIAETSPNLGASFFFTANVHDDPSKLFVTLAYQISVHHSAYREILQAQLTLDPTLLEKATTVQFEALFINPFAISMIHGTSAPLLILVDGLDECAGSGAQRQILELVSGFTTRYPSVPLLWIIASRPEPHITLFFDRLMGAAVYDKLELSYDSTESRRDVERFLRDRLSKIRDEYPQGLSHLPQWPLESQVLPLLAAADGMFAYAEAVSCFIEDSNIADPVSQLETVLDIINHTSAAAIGGQSSPMAQLYALYDRILSRIPSHILPITKHILMGTGVTGCSNYWSTLGQACQRLGLTASKAYSALHHLHAVLVIPAPEASFGKYGCVKARHKSFVDFISSRFPDLIGENWDKLRFSCYLRILKDTRIGGAVLP